jgi:glucosylceramidase
MKSSKKICGGKLLPRYYEIYARYFIKFIQAYEKEDIPIYAVTVQNEPGVDNQKMPSCKWTAEEEKIFIRDYLGPYFKKKQIRTKIWCYDHNFGSFRKPSKYPQKILRDPEAAQFIDGVAYHHYGGIPQYMLLLKEKFPQINLYLTEGSVFGLKGAQKLAKYIRNGVKSYNGWVPFIDTNKEPNNGPHRCNKTILQLKKPKNNVLINFDYFFLTHYSKFIQEGACHIFSEGLNKRKISEVSFLNPDNTIISIIANNKMRNIKIQLNWQNKQAQITIPKKSIMTICFKTNNYRDK